MSPSAFRRLALALTALSCTVVAGCRDGTSGLPNDGVRGVLTLTPGTATVYLGDTLRLKAIYLPSTLPPPADTGAVWTTSDDRIATVSAGLVRAVSSGRATIAVRLGTLSAIAA